MKALTLLETNNPGSRVFPIVLMLIGILCISVLSGVAAAFGNLYILIILLALYGLFFILVAPTAWMVWLIFFVTFLITGPISYFLKLTQFQWLSALMSVALLLSVLLYLLRSKTSISPITISSDFFWPAIFLLLVTFSTVIDQPQFADFVNASRHYFLMWPLMLVFMFGLVRQEMVVQLWRTLMIVAILQLPMALYQYFFVAQKSTRLSPWDAVIGTFHGDIDGGGESAGMGFMLLIAMLTAIALWRGGKLKGVWVALVVVTSLGTMALAEIKGVVLLIPVVIGLYYRREFLRRPLESVIVLIVLFLLVGSLLTVYEKLHYKNTVKQTSTYDRIMMQFDPELRSSSGNELGRVSNLGNWLDINVKSGDLQHSLFGYGMGATFASRIGTGELVHRFSSKPNTSSTTILLWEIGIMGHLVFIVILLSGARTSELAAKNESVPEIHRILLRVGTVGLLLLAVTLHYRNFHFYSNPIQFLMMLMLGQGAYWSHFISNNLDHTDVKTIDKSRTLPEVI